MSNLERSPAATVSADCRPVAHLPVHELLTASAVDLGEGTRVRRLLPKRQRATIGAWCFVDHCGPQDIAGQAGMRVPPPSTYRPADGDLAAGGRGAAPR